MTAIAVSSYAFVATLLLLKAMLAATVQGHQRMTSKAFRYPEDAGHWGGATVSEEADLVKRAQRLLLNDAETQPLFLALGAAYVALGAWPLGAPMYFGVYGLSRVAHAWFMLRPRQPHRNRAFAVGLLTQLVLAVHVCLTAGAALA